MCSYNYGFWYQPILAHSFAFGDVGYFMGEGGQKTVQFKCLNIQDEIFHYLSITLSGISGLLGLSSIFSNDQF